MATTTVYPICPDDVITRIAEGAITKGHTVVGGTAGNQAKLPAADTDIPLGVAISDATDGQAVAIARSGSAYVYAGAAIAINTKVYIHGTDGEVDDTVKAGGSIGTTRQAAAAAAERIVVDLNIAIGPFS